VYRYTVIEDSVYDYPQTGLCSKVEIAFRENLAEQCSGNGAMIGLRVDFGTLKREQLIIV
jgi:hypothetical protein